MSDSKYLGKRAKLGTSDRNSQLGEMICELQEECLLLLEASVPDEEERAEHKTTRRNAAVAAATALGHIKQAWAAMRDAHGGN